MYGPLTRPCMAISRMSPNVTHIPRMVSGLSLLSVRPFRAIRWSIHNRITSDVNVRYVKRSLPAPEPPRCTPGLTGPSTAKAPRRAQSRRNGSLSNIYQGARCGKTGYEALLSHYQIPSFLLSFASPSANAIRHHPLFRCRHCLPSWRSRQDSLEREISSRVSDIDH